MVGLRQRWLWVPQPYLFPLLGCSPHSGTSPHFPFSVFCVRSAHQLISPSLVMAPPANAGIFHQLQTAVNPALLQQQVPAKAAKLSTSLNPGSSLATPPRSKSKLTLLETMKQIMTVKALDGPPKPIIDAIVQTKQPKLLPRPLKLLPSKLSTKPRLASRTAAL